MYHYEVTYWQEGPGRSDYQTVLVAAASQKVAVKHVIEKCGVYTADQPHVKAKRVRGKTEAVILKHLENT